MYLQEVEVKLKRKYQSVDILKKFTSSQDAVDYAMAAHYGLCDDSKEHMFAVFLNRANRVIGHKLISTGSAVGCICDIKDILTVALSLRAEGLMLFHNHPSGNLVVSQADQIITSKLKNAATIMDIQLVDHIILTHETDQYYSFADNGIL